uniref:Uncharacterized protein n=1 Tax=Arundo donax TaxID=35708 RepID=A0A0A9HCF2_ARUDO
MQFSKSQV